MCAVRRTGSRVKRPWDGHLTDLPEDAAALGRERERGEQAEDEAQAGEAGRVHEAGHEPDEAMHERVAAVLLPLARTLVDAQRMRERQRAAG